MYVYSFAAPPHLALLRVALANGLDLFLQYCIQFGSIRFDENESDKTTTARTISSAERNRSEQSGLLVLRCKKQNEE